MKKLVVFLSLFSIPVLGFCGGSLANNATSPRNIDMGNNDNVTTGSLTVGVWAKPSSNVSADGIIGKKSDLTAATSGYFIYEDTGRVFHGIAADGVTQKDCNTGVALTGWTYLILTFNGANDNTILYENETAACGVIAGAIGSLTNGVNFRIGNDGANGNNFTGNLVYGYFFNTVLTPYERAELRWKPMSYSTTGTRSYWALWGEGTVEKDYGATNFPGTRTGFVSNSDGPPVMFTSGGL